MINPASLGDCLSVLYNLRPEDEAEYAASLGTTPKGLCATHLYRARPFSWCASKDEPIAIIAAHKWLPHRYGLSMVATPRFDEVSKEITRFIWTYILPALAVAGCLRAEALMVDGHPTAGAWLERLGANHEAVMPWAGFNGETMHLYAFTGASPIIQHHLERSQCA